MRNKIIRFIFIAFTVFFSTHAHSQQTKVEKDLEMKLYPNPATEFIHVYVPDKSIDQWNVSIVNLLGETVYKTSLRAEEQKVNVKSLKEGIYFVVLENNNTKYLKKFYKKQ